MVSIVIGRRTAAGAGLCTPVLGITVLAPRACRIAVTAILCCGVPAGAAGCSTAVLAGRRIAPGTIAHAVAGIIIIRCTAVSARACAPVLTGRILFPRAIAIAMTACIDRFALGLPASARIASVTVAGTGRCLLALQHPCMAAAVRTSAGTVGTRAVALIGVSAKVLDVVAGVTLVIVCMTTRRMCDFNVCALERILSA